MKIIVDKMPECCEECMFIGYMNYECKINGMYCGLYEGSCNNLKPITDCSEDGINHLVDALRNPITLDALVRAKDTVTVSAIIKRQADEVLGK